MATAVVQSNALPLILVVNHEPTGFGRLASSIRGDSYRVETAATRDLLERLQRRPLPNLVLMNVGMSDGGDGLEALRNARELHPDLKVVMTGQVDDTRSAAQAVRLGALDYLPEPVAELELEGLLEQYVFPAPPSGNGS